MSTQAFDNTENMSNEIAQQNSDKLLCSRPDYFFTKLSVKHK
jgi:hypothetical protein